MSLGRAKKKQKKEKDTRSPEQLISLLNAPVPLTPINIKQMIVNDDLVNQEVELIDPDNEKKICNEIINKYYTDTQSADNTSNALLLFLSAHGAEKTINNIEECITTNTIIDHIAKTYNLTHDETQNVILYIQNNIKISSSVPSGHFGAFIEKCAGQGNKSTRELEIGIIELYMNKLLEKKDNVKITKNDMSRLFLIIRYRLRYLFKALYENLPKRGTFEDYNTKMFFTETHNSATTALFDEVWRHYNSNLPYSQNKSYSFRPNPDEKEMDAHYGPNLIGSLEDGKSTIDETINLLERPTDESLIRVRTKETQYIFKYINSLLNLRSDPNIDNIILNILKKRKTLTLGDIIYLGYILGNRELFLFDPSCNYCNNNTRITTRSKKSFIGSIKMPPYVNSAFDPDIIQDSQLDDSPYGLSQSFGGKKNRRKTSKQKAIKKNKSKRAKRKMY